MTLDPLWIHQELDYEERRDRELAVAQAGKSVRHAIRRGALDAAGTQPCTDCGGPAVEYDHHLGYEREHWRHVQPVCHRCHVARHVARRSQGRILKAMP